VAVLTVLSRGPGMLLSAYGGQLADRYDRRRLCIVLFVWQATAAAVLAALVWDGIDTVTEVFVATFAISVAAALANPAAALLVKDTVPPELAKRATGLASAALATAVCGGLALTLGSADEAASGAPRVAEG
jgi:nitrate/nitrite transporter NarK